MATVLQHGIVIGGGIAGLLATRVLADHCKRITVIERDIYPDKPAYRSGASQTRQIHALPLKGQHLLEAFFPGFGANMLAAGARFVDFASDSLYFYGERCPRLGPGLPGWNVSRMLIEWLIRCELQKFSQVQWLEHCQVRGLLYEGDAVRGVKYQEKGDLENPLHSLEGELVIDASGSSSFAPAWLKDIGYEAPHEESLNPHIGYATRFYDHIHQSSWWQGMVIQGTGQNRRAGVLMEIENGQWMVLLAGRGKDYPPTSPSGFLAFAQSLPEPALYESMKKATPASDIYGYRPIGNRFRHYEQTKMPQGFIIVGDAVCTFNPIYGQGMTVAALEAQVLERCLRTWHQRKDPTRHFQMQIARLLSSPWLLATTADSAPEDRKNIKQKLANWYIVGHVIPAIPRDLQIERTFLEILHMLRTPWSLLHPLILFRVFGNRFERDRERYTAKRQREEHLA